MIGWFISNVVVHPRMVAGCLVYGLVFALGCGSGDPFSYAPVSGKITYQDGTPIPVKNLMVKFHPLSSPLNAKTHPVPGVASIDEATGEFRDVTSHHYNDGLVRGKHKVTLADAGNQPLPAKLVPPEYANPATTPLEVDTEQQPFLLKVRKP